MVQLRPRKRRCTRKQIAEDDSAREPVVQDIEKSPFLRLPVELHTEIFHHLDTLNDANNLALACKHIWAVFESSIGTLVKKHFLPVELEFLNVHRPNFLLKAHADELVRCGAAVPTRSSRQSRTKENADEYIASKTQYTFFPVEDATGSIIDHRLSEEPKVYKLPELRRLVANRKLTDSWILDKDGRRVSYQHYSVFDSKLDVVRCSDDKIIEGVPRELQIHNKKLPPNAYTLPEFETPKERVEWLEDLRLRNSSISATEVARFRHAIFSLAILQLRSIALYTRQTALRKTVSQVAVRNNGAILELSFRDLFYMKCLFNVSCFSSICGPKHWLAGYGPGHMIDAIRCYYQFRVSKFPEAIRTSWHNLTRCGLWDKNSELLEPALKLMDETKHPESVASWYQPTFESCASVEDLQNVMKELSRVFSRPDYYYVAGGSSWDSPAFLKQLVFLNDYGEIHIRSGSGPLGVGLGGRTAEFHRPGLMPVNFLQKQSDKFPRHKILPSDYDMEESEKQKSQK